MSFENFYLTRSFKETNENSTPTEVCSALRNSLVRLHTEGLKKLSNSSTNLILEQRLTEYSQLFSDNSESNSVNSLLGPINSLLKGKISTRHCSGWKSKLGSNAFDTSYYLKPPNNTNEHCNLNKNLQCDSDTITNADIRILLEKKDFNNATSTNIVQNAPSNPPVNINMKQYQQNTAMQSDMKRSNIFSSTTNVNNAQRENNSRTFQYQQPKYISTPNVNTNQPQQRPNFVDNSTPRYHMIQQKEQNVGNGNQNIQLNAFKTARAELILQNKKKFGNSNQNYQQAPDNNISKRSLGTTRSVQSKFIPPMSTGSEEQNMDTSCETIEDERLKHIDPKMVELIKSEIIDSSAPISWDDIAGLEFAKAAIQEAVVWPLLRPDIFTGLRSPPKGILLFGPPGTGKTLIGKCIASQCCATFFSISASSLTSKWIGDGEKMVRALFAVARCYQPAVVFIDEIDSLLTQRSDAEHEATRRIKTEFLVQLDGAATGDEDRFLVIGATNRPQELDEAARRRLVKRLYIPLPDIKARQQIINRLMSTERHSLTEEDTQSVAQLADGFSGADMKSLCSEAALGPIRAVPLSQITNIHCDQVRPVSIDDFKNALRRVRPSVSGNDLEHYTVWDKIYGSGSVHT